MSRTNQPRKVCSRRPEQNSLNLNAPSGSQGVLEERLLYFTARAFDICQNNNRAGFELILLKHLKIEDLNKEQ